MTGHSARIFRLAAVLLLIASVASAQRKQDFDQMMKAVGDGAAACSATKIAAGIPVP